MKPRARVLTLPQRNVMQVLVQSDGLSLKELSKQVGLAHATVSGIVDRLEKRGLVERRQDASDGRFTKIMISERRSALYEGEAADAHDRSTAARLCAGPLRPNGE